MFQKFIPILAALALAACESTGNGPVGPGGTDSSSDSSGDADADGDTDADADADGDADADSDSDVCADINFPIDIQPINMLILLDRSGSMIKNSIGTQTYAEVVRQALNTIVAQQDATDLINFGLAVFPSPECKCQDDTDCPEEDALTCKPSQNPENPLVTIAPDNSAEIAAQLASVGTCGGTPIADSLSWALSYLKMLPAEMKTRPTYVLLATDGAPNCSSNPASECKTCTQKDTLPSACPHILCLDDDWTYNQAIQINASKFKMFVIGVGNEAAEWQSVLDKIAEYGYGVGSGKKSYPAQNPDQLSAALKEITGEAVQCDFAVEWEKVPDWTETEQVSKACNKIRVVAKDKVGTEVPIPYSFDCSNPSGWRWKGVTEDANIDTDMPLNVCTSVELCSQACSLLKTAAFADVSFFFGCGGGVY